MDMDDIFEEQITRTTLDRKQDDKNRSLAIKEHKQLSKNLDSCRWCIDSEYMLKHMIVSMDSEICLSLPHYTSLTDGHCILTPMQHVACQLQLDENIWERLKVYQTLLISYMQNQIVSLEFLFIIRYINKFYTRCLSTKTNIQCSMKFTRVVTNFRICNWNVFLYQKRLANRHRCISK